MFNTTQIQQFFKMRTINTILRNGTLIFIIFSFLSFSFSDTNKFEKIHSETINPTIIKLEDDKVLLKWDSNNLKGIDYFLVQFSIDQRKYINVGQIMKKSKSTFQFIDKYRNSEYLSYRLVTVFKNGTFVVSQNEIVRNMKDNMKNINPS